MNDQEDLFMNKKVLSNRRKMLLDSAADYWRAESCLS
jgi:hypothetical protein